MDTQVKDLMAADWFNQEKVIYIDSKANFFVALFTLTSHSITSAPVYDEEKKCAIGILDILDLVTFALMTFEDRKMLYEREMLQFASNDLVNSPEYNAYTISGMSMRHELVTVSHTTEIRSVVELFTNKAGLHRVCVTNEEGGQKDDHDVLMGLISQTDLMRHIIISGSLLKDLTVGQWAVKNMVTCQPETEASQAFERLVEARVSALPVVDQEGRLITSFSASDLKGCEPGLLFKTLQESVIKLLRQAELKQRGSVFSPGRNSITCRVGDSVREVMQKMLDHKIHRVWVVEKLVVIGVVSLGDVFTKILENNQK